jgi:hypothetical protein
MIVNKISEMELKERLRIRIENQLNLVHPCIHTLIGFIFGTDSTDLTSSGDWTESGEVKIVKLYSKDVRCSK